MPRLLIITLCLLTALCQSRAEASDWVDGPVTQFQLPRQIPAPVRSTTSGPILEAPAPVLQPPSQPSQIPANAIGLPPAFGVTDPGMSGAPPDQTVLPHHLQGSANSVGGLWQGQADRIISTQTPMPTTATVPPKVYRGWLVDNHADLNTAPKDAIVEVKGQWDDSGHILHSFGLLSTKVNTTRVAQMSLAPVAVLVVDCAGEVPPNGLAAIEEFVRKGGYLLTTDWALDGCLARAIPGYIAWNGGYSRSELIKAQVINADPELLKGTVPKAYWKLDNKCQTVKINRPDQVEVLVASPTLAREDPNNIGALAVSFRYGKGRVLHLVGHFDSNSGSAFNNALPDPAPGIGISLRQAIAANFVMCALQAHRVSESAAQSKMPPAQKSSRADASPDSATAENSK